MLDKKFFSTAFTLTGTTVGAGILGLPYVFSKSGFFLGLFWLFSLGLVILFINLCLGEISLRTKKINQLPGYAEKYLGKNAERIMFFSVVFGIYSALLAYMIGEGQSLSKLFFGHLEYSFYFAIAFWLFMTIFLREGLKGLKKVELYGVMIVIAIIFAMLFWYFPNINFSNLTHYNTPNFFFPFGVVLFALLGFTSIPEMRIEILGQERKFKKAIILGTLIPVILYTLFTFIFVGILGENVPELATLSLGKFITVLGVFTMLTSFFVLSFSLRDIFVYDLRKRKLTFIFVSVIPLIVYIIVSTFNLAGFVKVLSIGGAISGGITGIMIFMTHLKAKKKGDRTPEFSVWNSKIFVLVLSLMLIAGILFETF